MPTSSPRPTSAWSRRFALHAGIAIERARLHERGPAAGPRVGARPHRAGPPRRHHPESLRASACRWRTCPSSSTRIAPRRSARVERAIDTLHVTIRDIRNFIIGASPRGARDRRARGRRWRPWLRTPRAAASATSMSSSTMALTWGPPATVQLLQTAREAVCNAVRHSRASSTRDPAAPRRGARSCSRSRTTVAASILAPPWVPSTMGWPTCAPGRARSADRSRSRAAPGRGHPRHTPAAGVSG